MNRTSHSVLLFCLLAAMGSIPALADSTLYDNTGPTSNGYNGSFAINGGLEVADSFTLASNSTLTGVNFIAWLPDAEVIAADFGTGNAMTSVDWLITTSAFGGTTEGLGTASVTESYLKTVQNGSFSSFDLYEVSFSLSDLSLTAGTYYLQLQNAVTVDGQTAYWDTSNGLSDAFGAGGGDPPSDLNGVAGSNGTNSETFQILGESESTVPEPSSLLLLGSGLLGLAGLVKRKLMA
jgi:hypothetical protein